MPTEIQEPVPAATSTLQANESENLYPVRQRPTSILEVKKQTKEAKSNRSRSVDDVHAIFHPPKNENKGMFSVLDYFVIYSIFHVYLISHCFIILFLF